MEIITSKSGFRYIYERESGYLSLIPDSSTESGRTPMPDYHSKKLEYLRNHGLIKCDDNQSNYRFLEKGDIENTILNTHQIILEVTDICNLECYYCGYGKLYNNYDERIGKKMSFQKFLSLYNHLKNLWEESDDKGCNYLRISFYGGEPLCNFELIEKVVDYVKKNPIPNKDILYSMTTNAVLLDRYIPFLVENKFDILISLDGNKHNDSYRCFKDGSPSFDTVIRNVDKLREYDPKYFSKYIKFNSVLHNRNSIEQTDEFIFNRYGKHPMTNELNVFGIAEDKREEFRNMFHSIVEEFNGMSETDKKKNDRHSPFIRHYQKWVFENFMNDYSKDISTVISDKYPSVSDRSVPPTGTCIPFSRKIFVTVDGKIYPCERIGNEFFFGEVTDDGVFVDFDGILNTYNGLFSKYLKKCNVCKLKDYCSVCIVSDIKGYEYCSQLKSTDIDEIISYFQDNPDRLTQTMTKISVK